MYTRFAAIRLFTIFMLGVVAMGDLDHAAASGADLLEQGGDLAAESNPFGEEDARGNLRAVAKPEGSSITSDEDESSFSGWFRKLMMSCIVSQTPAGCTILDQRACAAKTECRWNDNHKRCVLRKACPDVLKDTVCINRVDCEYDASTQTCHWK